jgi:hypothetical protein
VIVFLLLACDPGPAEPVEYERPVVVAERVVDFGLTAEGDVVTREIRLRNDGGLPFGVASVGQLPAEYALGGGFVVETPAPGTLVGPGEELVLDVSYTPRSAHDEDVVYVELFEDETTAWYDRAHPWMGIRLSGDGDGLPAAGDGDIVGGIVPAQVGLEPGDVTTLTVNARGTSDSAYTAPDALPCDEIACLVRAQHTGMDTEGNQTWTFIELTLWEEGELREPVLLDP